MVGLRVSGFGDSSRHDRNQENFACNTLGDILNQPGDRCQVFMPNF